MKFLELYIILLEEKLRAVYGNKSTIKTSIQDNLSISNDGELINEPVVDIKIVPVKGTEYIILDFKILPSSKNGEYIYGK
jgi:hypothetical protein